MLLDAAPGLSASIPDSALLGAAFAAVVPTTWLPDLAALSYLGAAGLASALAVMGLLVYTYGANLAHAGGGLAAVVPATTHAVHASHLPMTFGLLAFVFAGHAVFPAIYTGMAPAERSLFPRVLDQTYAIAAAVCLVVGFTGYATFGDATLEEVTVRRCPRAPRVPRVCRMRMGAVLARTFRPPNPPAAVVADAAATHAPL